MRLYRKAATKWIFRIGSGKGKSLDVASKWLIMDTFSSKKLALRLLQESVAFNLVIILTYFAYSAFIKSAVRV